MSGRDALTLALVSVALTIWGGAYLAGMRRPWKNYVDGPHR